MGRVRLNRHLLSRLTVLGGLTVALSGVYLLWGLAIVLFAGGLVAVACGLFLIDVDRR
ncbi:hypothetical protein [Amycolatopsis thermoflava]|uniref:hypothetical protein n=1 Tax=Amycolatopsis thermoflava TaxID=84480 RepID=UPI000403828A|nr:hypothetical protein [Amycolatopsis thermoflava]